MNTLVSLLNLPSCVRRSWDLRAKPSAPTSQLQHGHSLVTGLDLLDPNRLASTSADGTVCLWDIRSELSDCGLVSAKKEICGAERAMSVYGLCMKVFELLGW